MFLINPLAPRLIYFCCDFCRRSGCLRENQFLHSNTIRRTTGNEMRNPSSLNMHCLFTHRLLFLLSSYNQAAFFPSVLDKCRHATHWLAFSRLPHCLHWSLVAPCDCVRMFAFNSSIGQRKWQERIRATTRLLQTARGVRSLLPSIHQNDTQMVLLLFLRPLDISVSIFNLLINPPWIRRFSTLWSLKDCRFGWCVISGFWFLSPLILNLLTQAGTGENFSFTGDL